MSRYDEILKSAKDYLVRSKACSTCKYATNTVVNNSETLQVKTYCSKYNKDTTRHTGCFCEDYKFVGKV